MSRATKFRASTMALLVGLMLGSLRKVWPFRNALEEGRYECTWPQEFNGEAWLSLGLMRWALCWSWR